MHLREYLEMTGLTPAQFADRIGRDQSTVHKVLKGHPGSKMTMVAIYEATNGQVTPNDLVGVRGRQAGFFDRRVLQAWRRLTGGVGS